MRPGSRTRYLDQGIDHLHRCTRRLVGLTCLCSPNSSICSLCGQVDFYIGCISPTSGNKSVPVGLAAAVTDPRCAVVAQASFWRLGGGSWWSTRHWHPCPLCATAEATDPIRRSPFSSFPVSFTVLVIA